MKNTENAFIWITDLLESLSIPYQITGGFAARVYGVDRPLADIDFDVPEASIQKIVESSKPYITYGPTRYNDDTFDIELLTLEYEGQEIDIAGFGSGRIYDKTMNEWIDDEVDLSAAVDLQIFRKKTPVISKQNLIMYKKKIAREVDLEDVKQLISMWG